MAEGFSITERRYARLGNQPPRYRASVSIGAWLRPRWNEAIGLRVCDLQLLRKEVTFRRIMVNHNGSRTFEERFTQKEDCLTFAVPTAAMDTPAPPSYREITHLEVGCTHFARSFGQ